MNGETYSNLFIETLGGFGVFFQRFGKKLDTKVGYHFSYGFLKGYGLLISEPIQLLLEGKLSFEKANELRHIEGGLWNGKGKSISTYAHETTYFDTRAHF